MNDSPVAPGDALPRVRAFHEAMAKADAALLDAHAIGGPARERAADEACRYLVNHFRDWIQPPVAFDAVEVPSSAEIVAYANSLAAAPKPAAPREGVTDAMVNAFFVGFGYAPPARPELFIPTGLTLDRVRAGLEAALTPPGHKHAQEDAAQVPVAAVAEIVRGWLTRETGASESMISLAVLLADHGINARATPIDSEAK